MGVRCMGVRALSNGLTPAVDRVTRLKVAGLSNRRICERLCLTLSTVEQHLTAAYRAFGIVGHTAGHGKVERLRAVYREAE